MAAVFVKEGFCWPALFFALPWLIFRRLWWVLAGYVVAGAAIVAIGGALGDLKGITRYADVLLPMDEALTRAALDISGRPYLVWKVAFTRVKVGEFETELFHEFFQAFAQNAGMTLHVENLYGKNNHHIAETCFKALARVLRAAVAIDPRQKSRVPSTKGSLAG